AVKSSWLIQRRSSTSTRCAHGMTPPNERAPMERKPRKSSRRLAGGVTGIFWAEYTDADGFCRIDVHLGERIECATAPHLRCPSALQPRRLGARAARAGDRNPAQGRPEARPDFELGR